MNDTLLHQVVSKAFPFAGFAVDFSLFEAFISSVDANSSET
jgi:hypothetical protein